MSEVKDVRAALHALTFVKIAGTNNSAFDIASVFVSEGLAACDELERLRESKKEGHEPIGYFIQRIETKVLFVASILKRAVGDDEVLDLQALILPSSCSSSHQEIRYTGEKCPLCEALKLVDCCTDYEPEFPDKCFCCGGRARTHFGGCLILVLRENRERRAAFSRPSEAPAPKPETCKCIQRQLKRGNGTVQMAHFENCPVHLAWKASQPGAGEEGK